MKIGMILSSNFPPDIRVEKEARSLIKAGHEVHLLCSYNQNYPSEEVKNGIFVRRILVADKFFFQKVNSLIFHITFYHKKWAKEIDKFIIDKKIDVIHVHDLPLINTAITISKKYSIPIIADLHENYPAALSLYNYNVPFWKRFYFYNPKRWKKLEKKCLKEVNKIIVVVDEAKKRLVKDYNISPYKITIVSNTVDTNYFASIFLDKKLIEKYKNSFIISYVGGFGPHRGLDTAIKAMNLITKRILNVKLLLVGGKANQTELKKMSNKLNFQDSIIFTGWQAPEKLPTYIFLSHICLVPHHKNPHTDATIPHKLFQYMLMKKPIIVSNCVPLQRIINETRAGLVFEAGNYRNLAERVIQIYKNPDNYGENGKKAVLEKYNWEFESKKLITLYQKIKNGRDN